MYIKMLTNYSVHNWGVLYLQLIKFLLFGIKLSNIAHHLDLLHKGHQYIHMYL